GGALSWHYEVSEAAVAALPPSQAHFDSFTVAVSDGHGGTSTRAVTISAINSTGSFTAIWANPGGGDWNIPSNWASNALPLSTASVLIDLPSGMTVTLNAGTAVAGGVLVEGGGTLVANGGIFDITGQLIIADGALKLGSGGTIRRATISNNGGIIDFSGGTLD